MLHIIKQYIDTIDIEHYNQNYYIVYKLIIDKFYSDKDSSIYKINFVFYDKYKIEPNNFLFIKKLCDDRIGQTKFRNDLILFYQNCIITNDDSEICQACHILPHHETKINHIDNGLLLNYNLHHLFDSYYISFKFKENYDKYFDLYVVVISDKIKNQKSFQNYIKYDNQNVKISVNSRKFMEISIDNFLHQQEN